MIPESEAFDGAMEQHFTLCCSYGMGAEAAFGPILFFGLLALAIAALLNAPWTTSSRASEPAGMDILVAGLKVPKLTWPSPYVVRHRSWLAGISWRDVPLATASTAALALWMLATGWPGP